MDDHFWRDRRAVAESNQRPSAYQPNVFPEAQTGSPSIRWPAWSKGLVAFSSRAVRANLPMIVVAQYSSNPVMFGHKNDPTNSFNA